MLAEHTRHTRTIETSEILSRVSSVERSHLFFFALRSSFKVQFSRQRRIRHDDADCTTHLERNTLHFAR